MVFILFQKMVRSLNKLTLELRANIKEKKPDFIRQDYQRRKRLGRKLKWRKPKGIHSKIRHKFKGRRKMPSPGYKSPREVKGLHASGLKIINISSLDGIKNINKEVEGAVISKSIGTKKRLEILKRAKELGISVLNFDIDKQIKKIEEVVNSKKKKESKEKKKEEVKEKEMKAVEQKQLPALTDEQKKEIEKGEKDRVLTKKS